MKTDWLNPILFAGSMLYALAGVVLFWLCFMLIDRLTPYKLWHEIIANRNTALAIVVASMCIAIGMIVASAVHGG
jgi:putative membrane protein